MQVLTPDTPGVAEERRTVRTTVLLPIEMHAALNNVAKREHRSLHAQMLHWLSEALKRDQAQQREVSGGDSQWPDTLSGDRDDRAK